MRKAAITSPITIERCQPFGDYVRASILDPLGMKDTFTEVPERLRGDRLAIGHSARKRDGSREVIPPFQTRGIAPAAGFASNVSDLAKFAMWQFRLLSEGGSEVLRASTLREMQRVQWVDPDWKTTWGLGFEVSHEKDHTFVGHGGLCPGYRTQIRLEPKTNIAVIVLSNAIGTEVGLYTDRAVGRYPRRHGSIRHEAGGERGDEPHGREREKTTRARARGTAGFGPSILGCPAEGDPRLADVTQPRARILVEAPFQKRAHAGGVLGRHEAPVGSRSRIFAWVFGTSSARNGRSPLSISKSTTPKAQMSARLSTGFPRACSGDM